MHPLAPDLSQLSDDELHKKVTELHQRLGQSYRFGNYALVQQIQMLMENYQLEVHRRNEKLMADLAERTNEFKDIIDIN